MESLRPDAELTLIGNVNFQIREHVSATRTRVQLIGSCTMEVADQVRACLERVAAEPTRSLDPESVAAAVRAAAPEIPLRVVPNPHLALRAASEGLAPDDLLCATGSVYLAGIARRVLSQPQPGARVAVTRSTGRDGTNLGPD